MQQIADAEDELVRLRAEADQPVITTNSASPNMVVKLQNLQEQVRQLQAENADLQGSAKRMRTGRSRLREDFVPSTTEEIFQWMEDRQADLRDVTMMGNGNEVARICQLMASAAASFGGGSVCPSMVCNSVR